MSMINKKGFTLIELLAAMVILGMIMVIAIPNITGILNNSRNQTYVEDAKKFISMAEYKFRSDKSIYKPKYDSSTHSSESILIRLDYLDKSEFKDAPNGGPYDFEKSFVVIENLGEYKYFVYLVDSDGKGIKDKSKYSLYNKKPSELVTTNINVFKPWHHPSGVWLYDGFNNIKKFYDGKYGEVDPWNAPEYFQY